MIHFYDILSIIHKHPILNLPDLPELIDLFFLVNICDHLRQWEFRGPPWLRLLLRLMVLPSYQINIVKRRNNIVRSLRQLFLLLLSDLMSVCEFLRKVIVFVFQVDDIYILKIEQKIIF